MKNERIDIIDVKTGEKKEDFISDEWDLKARSVKVRSKGETEDITSDHIISYNNKIEKDYFKESRLNAHWVKNCIYKKLAEGGYFYKFNDKLMDWERDEEGNAKRIELSREEREKIIEDGDRIFNLLMLDAHTIIQFNRNVKDNPMLKHMFTAPEEKELPIGQMEPKSFFQKIKDRFSGKDEDSGDEDND